SLRSGAHTRKCSLQAALRIHHEIGARNDALTRLDALFDADPIAGLGADLYLARLNVAIALVDEDVLFHAGIHYRVLRNEYLPSQRNGHGDIREHFGLEREAGIRKLHADLYRAAL